MDAKVISDITKNEIKNSKNKDYNNLKSEGVSDKNKQNELPKSGNPNK